MDTKRKQDFVQYMAIQRQVLASIVAQGFKPVTQPPPVCFENWPLPDLTPEPKVEVKRAKCAREA
jgi:hypothetical protein